jgi:hypothetical protein
MRPATDGKNRYSAVLRSLREEQYPTRTRRFPNGGRGPVKRPSSSSSESQKDHQFVAMKRRRNDTNKFEVLSDLDAMGNDLGDRATGLSGATKIKNSSVRSKLHSGRVQPTQDSKLSTNKSSVSMTSTTRAIPVRGRRFSIASISNPQAVSNSQTPPSGTSVSISQPAQPHDSKIASSTGEIILLDSNWLRNYIKGSAAPGHCIRALTTISKTLNVVNFLKANRTGANLAAEGFNDAKNARLCSDCNAFIAEMAHITNIFEQSLLWDGYRLTAVIAIDNPTLTGMSYGDRSLILVSEHKKCACLQIDLTQPNPRFAPERICKLRHVSRYSTRTSGRRKLFWKQRKIRCLSARPSHGAHG